MSGNPTLFRNAKSVEKILRKDKYWHNQFRKFFLIDPLATNNAIYHDSLVLRL